MRITSGIYKGRALQTLKGMDVRPATDKVRQAVFNALLSRIDLDGVRMLDGFCGTGSYGLEALSRGAAHVTFVDLSRKSINICQQNIQSLAVQDNVHIICKDLLKIDKSEIYMDLIFLDPPYRKGLIQPAMDHLKAFGWANEETLFVLECEKDLKIEGGTSKTYGDVQIIFL